MRCLHFFLLTLVVLSACTGRQERAQMQQRLGTLNAVNRADTVLTATHRDEAQQLCRYFDRHGTPNEQMLAHYLLGRCYADMHEAPMALHCYQDAIDRADTTARDCDFAQLSRVYGQSARIFYDQGLYRDALEYNDLSVDYSWRGKDTLNALISYAHKASVYDGLHMKDSSILIFKKIITQLKTFGYHQVAAGFSGGLAERLINRGELSHVEQYIQDYEKLSGYFDSNGDIMRGREVYYNAKGLYYLKKNQIDSAEYFFRKELRTGKDFNNQNGGSYGLALLFKQKHMPDSAVKYALYAYAMNDSFFVQMTTHEVEQAKAMYDYGRQQQQALKNEKSAELRLHIIWVVCLFTITAICLGSALIFRQRNRQKRQLQAYRNLISEHAKAQTEVMQLREYKDNYEQLSHEYILQGENLKISQDKIDELESVKQQMNLQISHKEEEVDAQKEQMAAYRELARLEKDSEKRKLSEMPISRLVQEKATKGTVLSATDWEKIEKSVIEQFPEFHQFVTSKEHALTIRMYRICILTRLGIPFASIGHMMNVSAPTIAKACASIYKKLYGTEGTGKDLERKLALFH